MLQGTVPQFIYLATRIYPNSPHCNHQEFLIRQIGVSPDESAPSKNTA